MVCNQIICYGYKSRHLVNEQCLAKVIIELLTLLCDGPTQMPLARKQLVLFSGEFQTLHEHIDKQ